MKRILILIAALMVAFFAANAHCYPSYMYLMPDTALSGSISSTFTGDMNFKSKGSGTLVFNGGTNFNSWAKLNFETKVQIKVPINFPSGKGEVGFYGTNKTDDIVNMNGSDIIYNDGDLTISTLISNNSKVGQWNMIYTNFRVQISGKYYYPGDTFYSTPANKETAVIITDCKGTTLPIHIIKYSGRVVERGVEVMWEVANTEPIVLHYSKDGIGWIDLHNVNSPFLISDDAEELYVRISVENDYSETLIFRRKNVNEAYEVYDLNRNRLVIEPINEVYIKYFPRLKKGEKHLRY